MAGRNSHCPWRSARSPVRKRAGYCPHCQHVVDGRQAGCLGTVPWFLVRTAHSTRNLVMASVQRCAAQHPGRRAAETICRQFQCPRLHFSRRHLRQIWLSWRHGLPLGTGIWGGEDAEFEPRRLRRTWRLSRFWLITWNQSQSVSPTGAGFGSLHRRLRNRLQLVCSGGSTRNTLPARVRLL